MSDIYRISVAISMTNNVSAALPVIQRDVLGLGRSVDLTHDLESQTPGGQWFTTIQAIQPGIVVPAS